MKSTTVLLVLTLLLPLQSRHSRTFYTPSQLATQVSRSMMVYLWPEGEGMSWCSGFVVDAARGWLLTASHCIPNVSGGDRHVYIQDGTLHQFTEHAVLATDAELALIQLTPMQQPPLTLRTSRAEVGEPILLAGYPLLEQEPEAVYLVEHVATLHQTYLVTDGSVMSGMSGGPVVDEYGEVVGVLQSSYVDGKSGGVLGRATTTNVIRDFLKSQTR